MNESLTLEDFEKARMALQKANIPMKNLIWYFDGTEEEYVEFCKRLFGDKNDDI